MKKFFAAVICIALTTATSFAKHNQQSPAPVVNHKVEAQHRPHHDPVVDMELIKSMGLSPKKVQQIEALKQRKQQEMAARHPQRPQHHGKMGKQHHEKAARPQHAQKCVMPAHPQPGQKPKVVAHQHHGKHQAHNQQWQAHRAEMKAFKADYRKELCKIMGKDKYIAYVELQNDKMSHRRHQSFAGHKGHSHHSVPAHKPHPQAPNKG